MSGRTAYGLLPTAYGPLIRQREAERASLAYGRLHGQLAAVALDDPLGQIEAVARSAAAPLIELAHSAQLEDLTDVAGVDANAVVAHANADAFPRRAAIDGDLALTLLTIAEEKGVGDDRTDGLADLLGIDVHHGQVGGQVDAHAAFLDLKVVLEDDFFDDLAQRRRLAHGRPGQELDHVRHVVEHALHVLGARADTAKEVLPFLIELFQVVAEQQLAEAIDCEDRRFQIVRE